MLAECVALAQQRDATLVCSGDFFHVKRPQHVSHRLIQDVIDILRPFNEKILVVPGNHDMTERGLASLTSQPLGVLEKAEVIELLEYDNPYMFGPAGCIHARPYNVRRDADPTYYALTELEQSAAKYVQPDGLSLMVAHGSIIPNTEYRPYPSVRINEIDTTGIDVLACGHIHENLGTHSLRELEPGGTAVFVNVGALGRCSRTEANRTRPIRVVAIRPGPELDNIDLKSARPSDSIFIEATSGGVESDQIAEFVAALSGGLQIEQVGDVQAHIEKMGVPPFMAQMVMDYLTKAGL